MSRLSVADIRAQAEQMAEGDDRLQNTIIKGILHGDILRAIAASPLAKKLVFQGGTALTLCYGNPRYSEDLDFVHSTPLETEDFEQFKALLHTQMAERYGLAVEVKDPNKPLALRTTGESVAVHRWIARISIDNPRGVNVHKINIEVVDVPAYDPHPVVVQNPYDAFMGAPTAPLLLNVSSEREILADKVVAFAGRRYIKARDVWDIKWLMDRRTSVNQEWVARKAQDYHLIENGDMRPFVEYRKNKRPFSPNPAAVDHE